MAQYDRSGGLEDTVFVLGVYVKAEYRVDFASWQAKLNAAIAAYPGFVSLEMISPSGTNQPIWMIVQRFNSPENLAAWRSSQALELLRAELKDLLTAESGSEIKELSPELLNFQGGVTEVFVTLVAPEQEAAFKKWLAKIHGVEATFPGFRAVYVQCPTEGVSQSWITLLQFDTQDHLDRWLSSSERQVVLQEASPFITSLESHRVISPYAGWFRSVSKGVETPPLWKQSMLILLVLYPIVMLELRFLNPLMQHFNSAIATFIGNAISVSLISWPLAPYAIRFLNFWFLPPPQDRFRNTLFGTLLVLGLYLLEIALFW